MQLDLNEKEKELLQEVLERYLSELRTEIAGTALHDYREMLKERKESVGKILHTLQ
jgi:hypothetical protein